MKAKKGLKSPIIHAAWPTKAMLSFCLMMKLRDAPFPFHALHVSEKSH